MIALLLSLKTIQHIMIVNELDKKLNSPHISTFPYNGYEIIHLKDGWFDKKFLQLVDFPLHIQIVENDVILVCFLQKSMEQLALKPLIQYMVSYTLHLDQDKWNWHCSMIVVEWHATLNESSTWGSDVQLWSMFCSMLMLSDTADLVKLWNANWVHLTDELLYAI